MAKRNQVKSVNQSFSKAFANYKPPEPMTVSQWAERHRVLSRESSAEAGPWRNERTPYLVEPMDAFTDPRVRRITMVASSQVGKALAVDTPIPTPDGWKTMLELRPGDVVFDENGNQCNVIACTEVMYGRKCYEVTFSDGAKITADAEHQWYVEADKALAYPNGKNKKAVYSGILTMEQIASNYRYVKADGKTANNYAIPVNGYLKTAKDDLPLPPYTFGAWLGDGNSCSAQITTAKKDAEIIENIRAEGVRVVVRDRGDGVYNTMIMPKVNITEANTCGVELTNDYLVTGHSLLRKLGVLNNKHIPMNYLRASCEQRFALLQGIMDTDGSIDYRGRCEITLKSKQLVDDVSELLHTLGIKHTVKGKTAVCTNTTSGYTCTVFRISFMTYSDKPVFRLKRKLDRMKGRNGVGRAGRKLRTSETDRRRIVDVKEVESIPVKCIAVDSKNHLYLAGKELIPTHNSELELNIIGYIIDQDPGSLLYIQPTLADAKKFSKLRIAPMIRDNIRLRHKVADIKGRDANNTTMQKSFPGGMLTIVGSNAPSALASTPARYILGDERDRWARSAGSEGDPWKLAEARTTTYYNAKLVDVSTCTIKGDSPIADAYDEGTQERWCHRCPHCGEWHEIEFDNIKFDFETIKAGRKTDYVVREVGWCCPSCGCLSSEDEMRKQPTRWVATNPAAIEHGHRSFWLNGFASPWQPWNKIVYSFLQARKDPQKLKVVYNTMFGKLWEERGDLDDEETLLARREDYGTRDDGTPVELPEGVLVLTCGVDTQDDRLEYEVVGWGHYYESWGIKKGMILGDPNEDMVWLRLDDVLDHVYCFGNGRGLRISRTFVDSGGHKTQSVYKQCRVRANKQVFAIKGDGKPNAPLTKPPSMVNILVNGTAVAKTWLFTIGVNAAKADLLKGALRVLEPGPRYCHFPKNPDAGYDYNYFVGLLSETEETKTERGRVTTIWRKLPGHARNEPLDLRNYNYAAIHSLDPNMEAVERRLKAAGEPTQTVSTTTETPKRRRNMKKKSSGFAGDDW